MEILGAILFIMIIAGLSELYEKLTEPKEEETSLTFPEEWTNH